jgi:hypothetical protein
MMPLDSRCELKPQLPTGLGVYHAEITRFGCKYPVAVVAFQGLILEETSAFAAVVHLY